MSNFYDEQRDAKVMEWINKTLGDRGKTDYKLKTPGELISEKMVPSALEQFRSVSEEVASGIIRVAGEFTNIVDFRSSATRSVKITFVNCSPFNLVKVAYCSEHSNPMDGVYPPKVIEPGQTAAWGIESNGGGVGTEGWTEYRICGEYESVGPQDLGISFMIHWNNPLLGSNSCRHSWPLGGERNPFWDKVSLKDPGAESIKGDDCEMEWIFQYAG